ncbi:hypothetical protein ACVWXO_004368 [Bradyrhizobium sp. LM2.7]
MRVGCTHGATQRCSHCHRQHRVHRFGPEEAIEAGLRRVRTAYGSRIASVVHLAAYFDLTGEPNPLYEQITVHGTEKLLHGLQSFDVEQCVFASSMLAHRAGRPGEVINEDSPLESNLPYRTSKIETERLIHEQHGTIPIVYLRPAGVYDSLGIAQSDAAARSRQTAKNYAFFGAPVGLIVTIDRRLAMGSWLDLGMFIQNVMLAAVGRGLQSCPQETFARYHRILRPLLSLPAEQIVVCGISMGHPKEQAPMRLMPRADLEAFASFKGFEN